MWCAAVRAFDLQLHLPGLAQAFSIRRDSCWNRPTCSWASEQKRGRVLLSRQGHTVPILRRWEQHDRERALPQLDGLLVGALGGLADRLPMVNALVGGAAT